MKRIVHYLNQFYGQIAERSLPIRNQSCGKAYVGPVHRSAGLFWGKRLRLWPLLSAGDNYFADHQEDALETILTMTEGLAPDLFYSGSGVQCGALWPGLRNYLR